MPLAESPPPPPGKPSGLKFRNATSPFSEAVEISRYLASHCAPEARILVMGSEPEIYFYSRRRSATGYICTYPLMERQPYAAAMQREMIQEIERANPAYVVFVNIHTSWQQSLTYTNTAIFDWFDKYRQEHLQLVGVTEILPDQRRGRDIFVVPSAQKHKLRPERHLLLCRSAGAWEKLLANSTNMPRPRRWSSP